ncbi:MAG TPA: 3-deoxy-D-manno-octulosonic acid transferase [Pyrinomonadaceae bacterium]|nr:3-deoxy-D-manno-octulosonic acid transferase [Pyrinomonadaceae bacterium]
MYLAYSLLLSLGLLVLIPHFLYQALAHGKYLEGLRQRLGSLPQIPAQRPLIWLHCVSVGETQAARPLVQRLKREFPNHSLVVSTITRTGQTLASEVFAQQADSVFYFPFDWRWCVRRALRAINPSVVLLMETELWPNFLRECTAREIPVALVNGRISRQSFRRYAWIKFFLKRVLESLSIAVMQSEADASRLQDLGMRADAIRTAGNLKFDAGALPPAGEKTAEIRNRFGLHAGTPLILAASTHPPEEKILLESFRLLSASQTVRLMLAPRHPERFAEVASLIENAGLSWTRRTNTPEAADTQASVILLDTIGELPAAYALATVVFVGGSIVDRGGHNVLEPAAAGAPVVTGAHTHNFHAIVSLLEQADAIVQLPPLDASAASAELARVLNDLLAKPERRAELAARAKQLVATNQGATERTVRIITPLLSTQRRDSSQSNSVLATNAQTS